MFIRTSITLALCAALVACGGKNNGTEDGDADGGPDVEDVTEVTDPTDDPVEDPIDDPVDDPVEDTEEDTVEDAVEDVVEDVEEDAVEDAVEDVEDDTTTDATDVVVDTGSDTTTEVVDVTTDVTTDAPTVMLFFSEYVEGTSWNKAVEIYNAGTAAFDIGGCTVNIYYNGNTTAGDSITLTTMMLAADDVHVLCHNRIVTTGRICDQRDGNLGFNGDDAVELVCGGTVYDVIGQIGFDPGTEWGTGLVSTQDNTIRRMCSIAVGDADGSDAFDPSTQWDGFATNELSGLGEHCP